MIAPLVKPILRTAFDILVQGKSISKVTAYLNKARVAVPTVYRRTGQLYRSEDDRTEWRNSTIFRLIQSPVYLGHLVQRKANKTLAEKDYIRFEYAHEAYIIREEYDKIVPHLHSRRSIKKRTKPKTPNQYKGLIYAQGNSRQMYRYCRHFSNQKSDYDYYYFMDCVYVPQTAKKQTVYISEIALDRIISELIRAELNRLGGIKQLTSRLRTRKEDCISICSSSSEEIEIIEVTEKDLLKLFNFANCQVKCNKLFI